jgi:hypothetical protein
MAEAIPKEWRDAVCKILTARAPNTIQITRRAENQWLALFPELFRYDLFDGITGYLRQESALGTRVATMKEPGDTYAFIMLIHGRHVYAKICLRTGGRIVLVYSAHEPDKGLTV